MKNKILIAVLIAAPMFAASAYADNVCDAWRDAGEDVMTQRQNGTQMVDMLNLMSRLPEYRLRVIGQAIVTQAYNRPIYRNKELRDREIRFFGQDMYRACENIRSQQ